MLFRSAIIATLAACVTARKFPVAAEEAMIPDFNIDTNSKAGKRLLSKARRLENNNNNNDEQEADWLAGYSIKYDSCASLIQVREEGGGDEEGLLYTQNLVKFVICPGNDTGCSDCGKGIAQYVVNMREFVESYVEMKAELQEQACETIANYCYCENANDEDNCEAQCFTDAGMTECIQYEGQEDQDMEAMLECGALEGGDQDNNNNNNNNGNYNYNNNQNSYSSNSGVDMYRQYYIGPRCSPSDGKSIFMAAFNDAGCTSYAGSGVYEAFNYGYALPYESEPIVALNDCISCLQVDEDNDNNNNNNNNNGDNNNNNGNNNNNNYNNQNYDMEASEFCQQSYEEAAKCESKLSNYLGQYYYTDTSGCEYINNILPNLQHATRKITSGSSVASSGAASTAFAVVFGFTSCLLGAYAFFLYRKIHRAKVNLAQAEMGIA